MDARVTAVSRSATHTMTKKNEESIRLLAGLGVDGDAHMGVLVKHRSRVARDPSKPNLRQVHLIHAELLDELAARGFAIEPGAMGENVTTRGIALLALPAGPDFGWARTRSSSSPACAIPVPSSSACSPASWRRCSIATTRAG